MKVTLRSIVRPAALAAALLAGYVAIRAAEPDEPPAADFGHPRLRSPAELEAAINQALDRPAVMDYADVPLRDIVDVLKLQYGIEIQLHSKALAEAKIPDDKPITFSIKGASLRAALRALLEPINLTYVVDREVLLITTVDNAKSFTASKSSAGEQLPLVRLGEVSDVERALDKPATLKFDNMPLKDVAKSFAKQFDINVVLDRKTLNEANIGGDLLVTCDLPTMSLRQALHALLGRSAMDYTIGDNVLTITTNETAARHIVVRLYNVRELATPLGDFDQPGDQWNALLSIVQDTVAPSTWDSAGGAGSLRCQDGILIVAHCEPIQEQIVELVTALVRLHRAPRGRDQPERVGESLVSPLWKKLDVVQDVHFKGGSLHDLVAWLRGQGVPAEVDEKDLKEANLSDVKLSPLDLRRFPLRRAWKRF